MVAQYPGMIELAQFEHGAWMCAALPRFGQSLDNGWDPLYMVISVTWGLVWGAYDPFVKPSMAVYRPLWSSCTVLL